VAKRGRQKTEEIWDDMQPSVMGALARIYLLTGDPERARETLEAAPRELDASNAVGFLSPHGLLATVELALLRQEYAKGLRVVDEGLAFIDRFGLRPFYPELLSAKSNILLAQGEQDQAYRLLEQTRSEAESMGAKRILWQVLVTLARLEEERQNFERADRLRREALTIVERIAATLKERGLEASFLRLPQVQTLVAWGETET
jgi:tetratricopeptide (TPR) repeat protein